MERVTEVVAVEAIEVEGRGKRFIRTTRSYNGVISRYDTVTYLPRKRCARGVMVDVNEPDFTKPVRRVVTRSKPDALLAHEFAWDDAARFLMGRVAA